MSHKRQERVGDLIRKEIASMILHHEIKDPRIGFVTITRVRMSADLKTARVYFSQMGTKEEIKESTEGLTSAVPYIRRHLARTLSLKHIPVLSFQYDESIEYASHIERIIKEMKK